MNILNFPDTWLEPLGKGFCHDFLDEMESKFLKLKAQDISIFPPTSSIFRALELVNFFEVKVLILGQDPYHGLGQANGLSFSVNKEINIPPSLKNIFLELKNDLNIPISGHGDLTLWAKQKILLLNSVLTVEQGVPNSHQEIGWEKLTNNIISQLSKNNHYDFVCRWAGGNNAGHTIYVNGKKYKTHLIPSGVFFGKKSIIGPDCVVNINSFYEEIEYLKNNGFDTSLIKISPKAHIITCSHIKEDKSMAQHRESIESAVVTYLKEEKLYDMLLNEVREIPDIKRDPYMTCFGVSVYEQNGELVSEDNYAKTL